MGLYMWNQSVRLERGIPPLMLFLKVSSTFFLLKCFFGEFFVMCFEGLRTQCVIVERFVNPTVAKFETFF